jgi:carboxylesterase type B
VYAPGNLNATSVKRKSPVVVWIHGYGLICLLDPSSLLTLTLITSVYVANRGGYSRGSASGISNSDFFDGNDLISESPLDEPVVVVVIQYRLGLFGFLAGAEVGKRGVLNVGSCKKISLTLLCGISRRG